MAQHTEEPAIGRNDEAARIGHAAPLSALIADLMRQTADLVHNETALARAEISQKVSQVESGAISLMVAAVLGIAAIGALTGSAILGLSLVLAPWLAALIVGAIVAVVALIFFAVGRGRLKAQNLPPRATTANVRRDFSMLRGHAR